MTLRRRLLMTTCALLAGLILIGASSVYGLASLRETARVARDEYLELRMIQRAQSIVDDIHGRAQVDALSDTVRDSIERDIQAAIAILDEFLAFQDLQQNANPNHQRIEREGAGAARLHLVDQAYRGSATRISSATLQASIEASLGELGRLATQMDRIIAQTHEAAATRLQYSIVIISTLAGILAMGAIILGYHHYRSVMTPLQRLQLAMRRIATGSFSERVQASGDAELIALANDLNTMAAELESVYRDLEKKVLIKSRELVRSERLASVGFLAAGVAHEINNPLNIMSGYAELAISRLRKSVDEAGATDLRETMQIVRDEAFRCKEIVQKLLSLAKMGDGDRARISIPQVLDEVVFMVRAIKDYKDRSIDLHINDEALEIHANESEMKQVFLNLIVNALRATHPGGGRVVIDCDRLDNHVVIRIRDNGRGMTADTLDRVFEPFYTDGYGGGARGAGLGLSITHAIVEAHGGQVTATSDGVGCGSEFVVTLPMVDRQDTHGRAA